MIELFRFRLGRDAVLVGSWDETAPAGTAPTKWTLEYTASSLGSKSGGSLTLKSELALGEAELLLRGLEFEQREQHHQDDIRHREFQHENHVRNQQRVPWRP